jgi:ribonucleoside-diphosphate reductase alpha chain
MDIERMGADLHDPQREKYTYESAFKASVEYFSGNELAAKVFVDKYALRDKEGFLLENTPRMMHERLATELARIDTKYCKHEDRKQMCFDESYQEYLEALDKFARIVPQGSPMAAIGNPFQVLSASNCLVIASPEDSISGIFRAGLELAQLYKRRAGTGVDISTLRPDGMSVNNAARTTTGAWSFAEFYSFITKMIAQKGRRGALMITMDVHHPDVTQFATMKHDLTKVTGANVSIRLSDAFLRAVDEGGEYEQRFPCEGEPRMSQMVNAREVWDIIVGSATKTAEPGLIFWDAMLRNLPAHKYEQFRAVTTNPCCFDQSSNVFIITKRGIKEIKDVTPDDLVWIDEHQVWAETSGYFDAGKGEVFKVTLSNNEQLYITANHKLERMIRDSDGGRKVFYHRKMMELKDLQPGDFVALHEHEAITPGFGSTLGDAEDGALLGWLTGDGCLSYRKAGDIWPAMHLSCWDGEYDVADKLLKIARRYSPDLTICEGKDGYDNLIKRIISHSLTRALTEKYQTNLWDFKSGFNPFLYKASPEFLRGYLMAYFSADGTVANVPQNSRYAVQLASVDLERLKQIKNILCLFGIRSHIGLVKKASRTKIRGRYYDCADCYRLTISGYSNLRKFNQYIGFLSKEKQKRLDDLLSNFKREGRTSAAYAKIESIESVGIRDVGCIEVEGYHKFTANGVVSGNSEIILSAYDSCRLVSINLTAYVRNPFADDVYFDRDAFEKDVALAMRIGDNIVDLELELIERIRDAACTDELICDLDELKRSMEKNSMPPEQIKASVQKISDFSETGLWDKLWHAGHDGRRTGIGTHGLADTLAQLRIKYDSEGALAMAHEIYRTLRDSAYAASVDMAKRRGAFPVFDWDTEKDCEFLQRLPESLQKDIAQHGRRNISLLTQAPTGSVSLLSKVGGSDYYNVSSGVEPVFRNAYTRRKKVNEGDQDVRVDFVDDNGDRWQHFDVYHGNVAHYMDTISSDHLPDYFVTSDQIDWQRRIALQGVEQQFIDHSISSTINLPKGTSPEVVGELYISAWKKGLKGVTVYVDGSRDGVLITDADDKDKEIKSLKARVNELEQQKENPAPKQARSPKRPELLPSETHKVKVDFGDGNPRNAYVTVSFFPGTRRPYEILIIAPYSGLDDKDLQILELTARTTSMNLRHGLPVKFICEQWDKIGGQYIFSLPTNISKVLRVYLSPEEMPSLPPDTLGEGAITQLKHAVAEIEEELGVSSKTGGLMKCPDCGKRTYLPTGPTCGTCNSCGYSGCG